jgi:hypothetical protein
MIKRLHEIDGEKIVPCSAASAQLARRKRYCQHCDALVDAKHAQKERSRFHDISRDPGALTTCYIAHIHAR